VIPFATGLLEKRHDKVLERGAKLARRSPAELHALRIAIKKLRYAGEFFGSLFVDERAKLFRSRVAKLQESLGVINDQAAMPRLAQAATRRKAPGLESLLGGWSARVVHDERERLRDAWQQFRRTRKFW
jgi:CHAD domain-containing protein